MDKAGGLVSLMSLLFASIQQNALTLIDDFAVLNKNRVLLRSVLGMDLKTGDPGWPIQVVCSPHSRNFKPCLTERGSEKLSQYFLQRSDGNLARSSRLSNWHRAFTAEEGAQAILNLAVSEEYNGFSGRRELR